MTVVLEVPSPRFASHHPAEAKEMSGWSGGPLLSSLLPERQCGFGLLARVKDSPQFGTGGLKPRSSSFAGWLLTSLL